MRKARSQQELLAEINALPRRQRIAITDAVAQRRAVDDDAVASLAAEWALSQRRDLLRAWLIATPAIVAGALSMVWFMSRNDAPLTIGTTVVLGVCILVLLWLLYWAIWWRPLVRAERANRARPSLDRPSPR